MKRIIIISFIIFLSACSSSYEELRTKAEQGDATAQYDLANMFFDGKGVKQDFSESLAWFKKSAEGGNANAQFVLGSIFTKINPNLVGIVKLNYVEGVKWLRKAAEQGYEEAQLHLGALLVVKNRAIHGDVDAQRELDREGLSVKGEKLDYDEALKWIKSAAEQGNAEAQFILAAAFSKGDNMVKKDYVEASKWYIKSAKQGDVVAINNLGSAYKYGEGVPRDFIKAYSCYSISAGKGNVTAKENLDLLEKEISVEQIAEAQHLVRTNGVKACTNEI